MIALKQDPRGVVLSIKVVPGASRDRIVGPLGEALKIAVCKPPQDGAANRAVIQLLARELNLPQSSISILRGQTQPRKQVLIIGPGAAEIRSRLPRM